MKKSTIFYIFIISLLCTNFSLAKVTEIDIPMEPDVVSFSGNKYIIDDLKQIVKDVRPPEAIRFEIIRILKSSDDLKSYRYLPDYELILQKNYEGAISAFFKGDDNETHELSLSKDQMLQIEEMLKKDETQFRDYPGQILSNKHDEELIDDIVKLLGIKRTRIEEKEPPPKLNYVTPTEARKYFSKYIKNTLFNDEIEDGFLDKIFSHTYFGETKEELIKKYAATYNQIEDLKNIPNDSEGEREYFLTKDFGYLNHDLIGSIFKGAQKIMQISKKGDILVIFGNTPYFLGRALQALVSKDENSKDYREIIEFPFSGSPNRTRERSFPNQKNWVTKERLDHLRQRMREAGLSPKNERLNQNATYFIDVVASGAGIAYVIEELLREFKVDDKKYPDLNVITMNKIELKKDPRYGKISDENSDPNGPIKLSFPSKQDPHFMIDSYEVDIPGHSLLDMLPGASYRVWPEYNPCYWLKEYDYLLGLDKNQYVKMLLKYFDVNMEKLKMN